MVESSESINVLNTPFVTAQRLGVVGSRSYTRGCLICFLASLCYQQRIHPATAAPTIAISHWSVAPAGLIPDVRRANLVPPCARALTPIHLLLRSPVRLVDACARSSSLAVFDDPATHCVMDGCLTNTMIPSTDLFGIFIFTTARSLAHCDRCFANAPSSSTRPTFPCRPAFSTRRPPSSPCAPACAPSFHSCPLTSRLNSYPPSRRRPAWLPWSTSTTVAPRSAPRPPLLPPPRLHFPNNRVFCWRSQPGGQGPHHPRLWECQHRLNHPCWGCPVGHRPVSGYLQLFPPSSFPLDHPPTRLSFPRSLPPGAIDKRVSHNSARDSQPASACARCHAARCVWPAGDDGNGPVRAAASVHADDGRTGAASTDAPTTGLHETTRACLDSLSASTGAQQADWAAYQQQQMMQQLYQMNPPK